MTSLAARDLTFGVFKGPVATEDVLKPTEQGTLTQMFHTMADRMNNVLKNTIKEKDPKVTVAFSADNGTFDVVYGENEQKFSLMKLGPSLKGLNTRLDESKAGNSVPQMLLMFFQVFSMLVYEVVVECVKSGKIEDGLLAHIQHTVLHMIIMLFLLIVPNLDGNCSWRALFLELYNLLSPNDDHTDTKKLLVQYNALLALDSYKDKCAEEGLENDLKHFADHILLMLGKGEITENAKTSFKRVVDTVNAALDAAKKEKTAAEAAAKAAAEAAKVALRLEEEAADAARVAAEAAAKVAELAAKTLKEKAKADKEKAENEQLVEKERVAAQQATAATAAAAAAANQRLIDLRTHIIAARKLLKPPPTTPQTDSADRSLAELEAELADLKAQLDKQILYDEELTQGLEQRMKVPLETRLELDDTDSKNTSDDVTQLLKLQKGVGLLEGAAASSMKSAQKLTDLDPKRSALAKAANNAFTDAVSKCEEMLVMIVEVEARQKQRSLLAADGRNYQATTATQRAKIDSIHNNILAEKSNHVTAMQLKGWAETWNVKSLEGIRHSSTMLETRRGSATRPENNYDEDIWYTQHATDISWSPSDDPWTKAFSKKIERPAPVPVLDTTSKPTDEFIRQFRASMTVYLQCAYIRAERFFRSYTIQVNVQSADLETTDKTVYDWIYGENALNPGQIKLWPVLCDQAYQLAAEADPAITYDLKVLHQMVFDYMAVLNACHSEYDQRVAAVKKVNDSIRHSKLKTVLFMNKEGSESCRKYSLASPVMTATNKTNPFFADMTFTQLGNKDENGPETKCKMIVGPLACNAIGSDFSTKMDNMAAAMTDQIQQLKSTPMIIMGYGSSGSGKTTCLFGLEKDGIKLTGLLEKITNVLSVSNPTKDKDKERLACKNCTVTVHEYYVYDISKKAQDLNDKYLEQLASDQGEYSVKDELKALFEKSTKPVEIKPKIFTFMLNDGKWEQDLQNSPNQPYQQILPVENNKGRKTNDMMAILKDCVELSQFQASGDSRKVSTTFLNRQSSRSHVIMDLSFKDTGGAAMQSLYIADFAGVENLPSCDDPQTAFKYASLPRSEGVRAYREWETGETMLRQYGGEGEPEAYQTDADWDASITDAELTPEVVPGVTLGKESDPAVCDFQTHFHDVVATSTDVQVPTNLTHRFKLDGYNIQDFLDIYEKTMHVQVPYEWYEGYATEMKKAVGYLSRYTYGVKPHECIADNKKPERFEKLRAYTELVDQTLEVNKFTYTWTAIHHDVVKTPASVSIKNLLNNCMMGNAGKSLRWKQDDYEHSYARFRKQTGQLEATAPKFYSGTQSDPVKKGNEMIIQKVQNYLDELVVKNTALMTPISWLKTAITNKLGLYALACMAQLNTYNTKCEAAKAGGKAILEESNNKLTANNEKEAQKVVERNKLARKKQIKLRHGMSICRLRVAEGTMINASLKGVRNAFAAAYSSVANGTIANIPQNEAQCAVLNNMHFGGRSHMIRYEGEAVTQFEVVGFLQKVLAFKPQPNAFLIGVFNDDSAEARCPPKIDYIPCSELEQELKRLEGTTLHTACNQQPSQVMVDQGTMSDPYISIAVLDKFLENVKEAQKNAAVNKVDLSPLQSVYAQTETLLKNRMSKTRDLTANLKKLILEQTNNNSNTPIGTLEFIDQACKKFSTNQTFCFDPKGTISTLILPPPQKPAAGVTKGPQKTNSARNATKTKQTVSTSNRK